jgi:flagellar export protein FliJ
VKRFHFTQEKILDYRRQQLELEEAKMETLRAERQALDAEWSRLESEVAETRRQLMVTASVDSQELLASDRYLRHLAAEKQRLAARLADWQGRAAKQRQATAEARRRVRLMEKLEERQLSEWTAGVNREQENLSAELYLARWNR